MHLIKIAERLKPFSHIPGTFCVVPRSNLRLQIFPVLVIVHELSGSIPKLLAKVTVPIKGPVKEFTAQLDLEEEAIHVWGKTAEGYFRYHVFPGQHPFRLTFKVDKGLASWIPCPDEEEVSFLIQTVSSKPLSLHLHEHLSLGNHKSQDWDGVRSRGNLVEILPAWLRLGQLIEPQTVSYEGTAALLKVCETVSKIEAYDALKNLFNAAFEGILSPRLTDEQHQGFNLSTAPVSNSPLMILKEGARIIRSLFIQTHQKEIFILPKLLPQFHCGRFIRIRCNELGILNLEWTKKAIRRMTFQSAVDDFIQFHFPKYVHTFRLNDKIYQTENPIEIMKGQIYNFDRFQK